MRLRKADGHGHSWFTVQEQHGRARRVQHVGDAHFWFHRARQAATAPATESVREDRTVQRKHVDRLLPLPSVRRVSSFALLLHARREIFTIGTLAHTRPSYRWTGFSHPDQTLEQLRTMQRLFLRMMVGDVKNTEPDFESRAYLPKTLKVTTSQWAALVPEAYIWMVCTNTVVARHVEQP